MSLYAWIGAFVG